MRRIIIYSLLIIFFMEFSSCKRGISDKELKKIDLSIKIQRFEKDLFTINSDSLSKEVRDIHDVYNDFFDVFSYYVINIGSPYDRDYTKYLDDFINNPLNREVYASVQEAFPDLSKYEREFEKAFKIFKYYFPSDTIPTLVSYISGFNYPTFTVGNFAGIGLDMFLGEDSEYYTRLGLSEYQKKNLSEKKMVSDIIYNWANDKFSFNDSVDNVLAHIIHEGKIMFFVDALLPDQAASQKFSFSKRELEWIDNNEEQMWLYLIEHKLLYSTDNMNIRKLIGPAPYTSFFTADSPGRAIIWNGFSIVSRFADQNPKLSLKDIMLEKDYQKILTGSKYNP